MLNTLRNKLSPLPDAISLLKDDHREVEALFLDYENEKKPRTKTAIVRKICFALTVHTRIEEKVFYPAARQHKGLADMVDEAVVEHAGAKRLIRELKDGRLSDDLYKARVTVLKDYIQHHVKEEETEIFPKVQATDLDLTAIGEKLGAAKERALAAAV